MSLPKYHIYLEYENEKPTMRFNLSEEELVRTFISLYTAGKLFWFCGRLLKPTKVAKAIIFSSQETADKLVLPNREEVANHPDKKFVMNYILRGKVKAIQVCTEKFLPAASKQE